MLKIPLSHQRVDHNQLSHQPALNLCGVPNCGTQVMSLLGPRKKIGKVLLAPGGKVDAQTRRQLLREHDTVMTTVRAEAPNGKHYIPLDFHAPTLRWIVQNADVVMLTSAPFRHHAEKFLETKVMTTPKGAKFTFTIETTHDGAGSWRDIIARIEDSRPGSVSYFDAYRMALEMLL